MSHNCVCSRLMHVAVCGDSDAQRRRNGEFSVELV